MKSLFVGLVVLTLAVLLGLELLEEPGYVMIGYAQWSVETTLSLLVLALVVGFALLYFTLRFLGGLRHAPRQMRKWDQKRRALNARNSLNRGLMELSEGNWVSAERRLLKHVEHSDNPLMNYLAAARAAQHQGEHQRRDHYLRLAHQAMPAADIAVGLTQAELQISHRQMEQALATLTHLRTIAPRHGHVLKMLMKLYKRLHDWEHLRELLPALRKRKVISEEQVVELESRIHRELLQQAATTGDASQLKEVWGRMPRRFSQDESLIFQYAQYLQQQGADMSAYVVLRAALKKHWSERLVYLYGCVKPNDPSQQMAEAEEWLREHEKNPVLLQALGRIAIRNKLWGKARSYLEASISITPTVESYQILGNLLEQLGKADMAMDAYRQGMLLTASGKGLLVSPEKRRTNGSHTVETPGDISESVATGAGRAAHQ